MKKLIIYVLVVIFPISCIASNYRGMFDIGGGPIYANATIHTSTGNFKNKQTTFGGLFSTTHGCQFTPWLFTGAGVGINCERINIYKKNTDNANSSSSSKKDLISIPFYLDIRWDLDVNRKITPYADFRLGYQLGMDGYVMYKASSVTNPSFITAGLMKSADAMYIQASAGVRFKAGNNIGVNVGISFVPMLRREILLESPVYSNRSFLLLNAGIDIQGEGKGSQKEDRKAKLYRLQQQRLKKQSKKFSFQ